MAAAARCCGPRRATPSRSGSRPRIRHIPSRRRPVRLTDWRPPRARACGSTPEWRRGASCRRQYDPLFAKLMVVASDRGAAIARLRRALDEFDVGGVQTTLPFDRWLLGSARLHRVTGAGLSTDLVERRGSRRRSSLAAGLRAAELVATRQPRHRRAPPQPPSTRSRATTARLRRLVVRRHRRSDGEPTMSRGPAQDERPGRASSSSSPQTDQIDGFRASSRAASWSAATVATAEDRALGRRRFEVVVGGWRFDGRQRSLRPGRATREARYEPPPSITSSSATLRAQIPGRVVRVWVRPERAVEPGERLLAIEAMKMENEIRAPRAGTIQRASRRGRRHVSSATTSC